MVVPTRPTAPEHVPEDTDALTPSKVVELLDRFIVGQARARGRGVGGATR